MNCATSMDHLDQCPWSAFYIDDLGQAQKFLVFLNKPRHFRIPFCKSTPLRRTARLQTVGLPRAIQKI